MHRTQAVARLPPLLSIFFPRPLLVFLIGLAIGMGLLELSVIDAMRAAYTYLYIFTHAYIHIYMCLLELSVIDAMRATAPSRLRTLD